MPNSTDGTGGGDRAMRVRRLRFRAWHRGMREVDLILGRFADAFLDDLNDRDLGDFEMLLDVPDRVFLGWATGEQEVPADEETPLLRRILEHYGLNAHQ